MLPDQPHEVLCGELTRFKREIAFNNGRADLTGSLYDDTRELERQLKSQQFIQYLSKRFDAQQPTSIIRLVDGEGSFLALAELAEYPAIKKMIIERIGPHYFGYHKYFMNEDDFEHIGELIRNAASVADVLGVPSVSDLSLAESRMESGWFPREAIDPQDQGARRSTEDLRAYIALIINSLIVSQFLEKRPDFFTTFSGLHTWLLWDIWRLVLEAPPERRFIGVVTCHPEFEDRLTRRLARRKVSVKSYLVTPRGADADLFGFPAHYPDVFNHVCNSFSVPFKGAIFIVGAGPLGKVYCQKLKELGAIAIDMGSALDLYLGKSTREWHSDDIMKLHRFPD